MSYPKTLSYGLSRLNSYSTQLLKIRVNQGDTAYAGQVVSFDLPFNSLVDLESIRFCARVRTTGFAHLRHSEGLIRQIMVESGGQMISSGFDHTPILWNIFNDFQAGDKQTSREIYNSAATVAAAPTTLLDKYVYVNNLLGFIGSASPRFIDTSLFPNGSIRVSFRLADLKSAFVGGGATALTDYNLSEMYLLVRVADISDGLYYSVLNQRLQSGAGIEIPFQNVYSFNGGDRTATSTSLLFSLSSQSVDALIGTVIPANSVTSGSAQNTAGGEFTDVKNSVYYVRGSVGVNTGTGECAAAVATAPEVQWKINNVAHPSYGYMNAMDTWTETLSSMNLLQDQVGALNGDMKTVASWQNHFFVSAYALSHPSSDGLISGLNSLGTNGQAEFLFKQNAASTFQPLVFVLTTAVLKLGAGRTMAVTY
jgi:hypothetical protein